MTQQVGRVGDIRRAFAIRIRSRNATGCCSTDKQPGEDADGIGDVDVTVVVTVAAAEASLRWRGVGRVKRYVVEMGLLAGGFTARNGPHEWLGFELGGEKAVRRGGYKAVLLPKPFGNGDWRLYRLELDPAELYDDSERHPEVKAALAAQRKAAAAARAARTAARNASPTSPDAAGSAVEGAGSGSKRPRGEDAGEQSRGVKRARLWAAGQ